MTLETAIGLAREARKASPSFSKATTDEMVQTLRAAQSIIRELVRPDMEDLEARARKLIKGALKDENHD